MCILLKLNYAKFGVSNLFFQKLSKKNLWGVGSTPFGPLGQEGLSKMFEMFITILIYCITFLGMHFYRKVVHFPITFSKYNVIKCTSLCFMDNIWRTNLKIKF